MGIELISTLLMVQIGCLTYIGEAKVLNPDLPVAQK